MKANWAIIPKIDKIEESLETVHKYDVAFEYNDFFIPAVYENSDEVKKRIDIYRALERNRKNDTLHGVFFDIVAGSKDSVIRQRSRQLMEYSLSVAEELECKGVVFHTGLIAGLNTKNYIDEWVKSMSEYFQELSRKHQDTFIYIENTFETTPVPFVKLMKECGDNDKIRLCLDYAHAVLTPTPIEEWTDNFYRKLGHIHVNDNDLVSDLHLTPGNGDIDFGRFKEIMKTFLENEEINTLIEINDVEQQMKALDFLSGL